MTETEIESKIEPIFGKIQAIAESYNGMNIGTGLQDDIEAKMREVLPEEIGYEFSWNMSGQTHHYFFEKSNPSNFISL